MKVFLPAIEGLVPADMVCCVHAFLDFCYLVHHDFHDTKSLKATQEALDCFHQYCSIFIDVGLWEDFNLPRQHLLCHYVYLICKYVSLNGICSSITENKHIKGVKEPWQQSNKWEAMHQMLVTNQHMNKLAALCTLFKSCGLLKGTCLSNVLHKLCVSIDYVCWINLTQSLMLQKLNGDPQQWRP